MKYIWCRVKEDTTFGKSFQKELLQKKFIECIVNMFCAINTSQRVNITKLK